MCHFYVFNIDPDVLSPISSVSQMCELLHYFCDCELKHRIEAIVSFSDNFVSKLQFNQKYRYNELMLALNMSAAVTAKKTKEFRSPPQEQVRCGWRHFKL